MPALLTSSTESQAAFSVWPLADGRAPVVVTGLIPLDDWPGLADSFGWTDRETQAGRLLLEDYQCKEIAKQLGCTFSTARAFIQNVYAKTGARRHGGFILRVVARWLELKSAFNGESGNP